MKSLIGLAIGLLSLAGVVASSSPVVADQVCIPVIGCVGPDGVETTFTTFNVYVHNKSSHPMTVTVESWRQPNNQGRSCPGGGTSCLPNGWRTQHWDFRSGEKALILDDVEGRNIYFSAKATDGSRAFWSRQKIDMGSTYTRFEYSLSD